MNFMNHYIYYITVFSPLVASVFITLIPTSDMGSKRAVSKFFAAMGLIAFLRLFFLSLHKLPQEMSLSFSVVNFHINFSLILTTYNLFLYGAASFMLVAQMFSRVVNDNKTNIHQVSPFVLTFILNICFGQSDVRVALPVLSIANFLIYFLIGTSDKDRRGSTIFQMGIFLFSCDALVLVLLQISYSTNLTPSTSIALDIILLSPALARLCLPLTAPFMKKLLANVDSTEGPFIIIFLQLAGIAMLIFAKTDLIKFSVSLSMAIGLITLVGAIFIVLLAITARTIDLLPYYILVFYNSFGCMIFFINEESSWYFSISLLLSNSTCFFYTTRCVDLINKFKTRHANRSQPMSLTFLSLVPSIGLPGLGIGSSLWPALYYFSHNTIFNSANLNSFWLLTFVGWMIGFFLLSLALILSVLKVQQTVEQNRVVPAFDQSRLSRTLIFATLFVALLSWIVPLATYYAATIGLK